MSAWILLELFAPAREAEETQRPRPWSRPWNGWPNVILADAAARSAGPQTLTEGGTWHQLAAVLYGYAAARSFNFDYLRLTRRQLHGPLAPLKGLLRRV